MITDFQLFVMMVLLVCAALLILSFVPSLKKLKPPSLQKQRKAKKPTTFPISESNRQIIIDALTIIKTKVRKLEEHMDKILNTVASL